MDVWTFNDLLVASATYQLALSEAQLAQNLQPAWHRSRTIPWLLYMKAYIMILRL